MVKKKDKEKLMHEWNKKLEALGLPEELGNTTELYDPSLVRYVSGHRLSHHRTFTPMEIEAKSLYFSQMTTAMSDFQFKDEVDRNIMELHCEGIGPSDIVNTLKAMGWRRHRTTVMYTIRRYEQIWGIRVWDISDLRSK